MIYAPAIAACSTLVLLAVLHLYWAVGGQASTSAAVPSVNSKPLLTPSPAATALVAAALFAAAALVAATAGLIATPISSSLLRAATGLLALVFLARSIGDFRYVGFFKRVKGSPFAMRDTNLYSPLCVVLAVLIGAVAVG